MINEEWRNELLSKINIADIVGEYTSLVNKGGRLWACCPFHNEKTPSFTVNTDKQFYHCFGCGKGGNVINFVMELEKMTYPEACQYLAEKANLPMPQMENKTRYEELRAQKEKILEMNKIAAKYFHSCLFDKQGESALAYLKKRGVTDSTIKTFGIGYAPESWDSLLNLLKKNGFSLKDVQEAGLAKASGEKCFDMFRNRVMMPIINSFSEVIGFGGRVMDSSEPKYLNSPETAVFNKRKNLYNLNLVRKLRNLQYLVLVEGYMDAISLHMYGVQNVVATLGTALTAEQAKLIVRYAKNVVLSYDGDDAGQKATLRALDILEPEGLETRVIVIPDGMDPDDYLKKFKKDGFIKLISTSLPALEYKMKRVREKYDLKDAFQMEQYARDCVSLLKSITSPMLREKYVRLVSKETGFSENSIYEEIGVKKNIKGNDWDNSSKTQKTANTDRLKAEQYVLLRILEKPECAGQIAGIITEDDFEDDSDKKIFSAIINKIKKGFTPTNAEILSELSDKDELRNHAAALFMNDVQFTAKGKQADDFFSDCIRDMQIKRMQREKEYLLQCYGGEKNEDNKKELLNKINRLTKELHIKKQRID